MVSPAQGLDSGYPDPMARDDEAAIDRLYQIPLAGFTAARNELANARGKDGAAIKRLQKPSPPAWAINQLYWQRPKVHARLVEAAEARRAAHAMVLSGQGGDVASAERAHQAAVRAAANEIRELLRAAGETMTPATLNAIVTTLQVLPDPAAEGRLVKPLEPRGFEALAGLVPKMPAGMRAPAPAAAPPRKPGPAARSDAAAEAKRAARDAKRAAEARRREKAAIEKGLRSARRSEQQAVKALETARRTLADAERRHDQLRDQLQFALKQIQDSRDQISQAEQRRREGEAERARLESRLSALRG
jgi:enamine deaminase RidA (YjgF/YER057c/UK114 family)